MDEISITKIGGEKAIPLNESFFSYEVNTDCNKLLKFVGEYLIKNNDLISCKGLLELGEELISQGTIDFTKKNFELIRQLLFDTAQLLHQNPNLTKIHKIWKKATLSFQSLGQVIQKLDNEEIGFVWIDGVLVRAMEEGHWLLLENVIDLKVLLFLLHFSFC